VDFDTAAAVTSLTFQLRP